MGKQSLSEDDETQGEHLGLRLSQGSCIKPHLQGLHFCVIEETWGPRKMARVSQTCSLTLPECPPSTKHSTSNKWMEMNFYESEKRMDAWASDAPALRQRGLHTSWSQHERHFEGTSCDFPRLRGV